MTREERIAEALARIGGADRTAAHAAIRLLVHDLNSAVSVFILDTAILSDLANELCEAAPAAVALSGSLKDIRTVVAGMAHAAEHTAAYLSTVETLVTAVERRGH